MERRISSALIYNCGPIFFLRLGKYLNETAEFCGLSKSEIILVCLRSLLVRYDIDIQRKFVISLKLEEPRITLLVDRKKPTEDVDQFLSNFSAKIEKYLTGHGGPSRPPEKPLSLICCMENEQ